MKKTYTDQFKLSVIEDYYSSSLGVRVKKGTSPFASPLLPLLPLQNL